jgi:hypothetical protein
MSPADSRFLHLQSEVEPKAKDLEIMQPFRAE